MCHFSTASPWLSSGNYGITTRVKLKPSTVSEYKIERDTVSVFGYWNLICRKGRLPLPALPFTSERRKPKSVQRKNGGCFFPVAFNCGLSFPWLLGEEPPQRLSGVKLPCHFTKGECRLPYKLHQKLSKLLSVRATNMPQAGESQPKEGWHASGYRLHWQWNHIPASLHVQQGATWPPSLECCKSQCCSSLVSKSGASLAFLHQRVKDRKYTCSWFCSRCKILHPWSRETCLKEYKSCSETFNHLTPGIQVLGQKPTDKIPQCNNNITTWLIHGQIPKRINRRDTLFLE